MIVEDPSMDFLIGGPCPLDLILKHLKRLHVKRLTQDLSTHFLSIHMASYVLFTLLDIGYHLQATYLANIIDSSHTVEKE